MLNAATKRSFGFFSSLKKMAAAPMRLANVAASDGYANYHPLGNVTEKFDEEAQEWKSIIVAGAYELNAFQGTDQVIQPNFGTLDNPHLIFTSDIPYRFVGCTGAPNEDDYEGHEMMYMLLREGPLQRCMSCGQVFKLVRLRDEKNTQNEYYKRDFVENDVQDVGEADHWIQLHPIRFMMMNTYEHTHFETPSDGVFLLKNEDDHDRLMVDPAYRLEQLAIAEKKRDIVNHVEEYIKYAGKPAGAEPVEYSKNNYENLIQAGLAIERLRNHFKAVQRFQIRAVLDPVNHERREKRMQERALERTQKYHAIYLNEHSEPELQYRDYYESDEEALAGLNLDLNFERQAILSNPSYKLDNFVFLEQYSSNKTPDSTSYIDKKVFRFNYRQAQYSHEDYIRKERRMRDRLAASGFQDKVDALTKQNAEAAAGVAGSSTQKLPLYELLVNQAVENYRNFFESDLEEDFEFVADLPLSEKKAFASTMDTSLLVKEPETEVTVALVSRSVEPEEGVVRTIVDEFQEGLEVLKQVRNLTGVNRNQEILGEALQKAMQKRQEGNGSKE